MRASFFGTIRCAPLSAQPLLRSWYEALKRKRFNKNQILPAKRLDRGAEADGLEYGHSGIGLEIGEEGARGVLLVPLEHGGGIDDLTAHRSYNI